jgi:zinc protease
MSTLIRVLNLVFILTGLLFSQLAQSSETAFETDPRLPLVYINVAFKAGSVSDPAGKSGLTNFMGETLLRGTLARTKSQIDLALDQIGARLEVETRAEALIFRGAVLSSQLGPFLSLLSEIVTQPSAPENEIKKLKSEIVSALQEELGHDSSLAVRRFNRFLFRNHPYGKPVLGTVHDIENLSREDILTHYRRIVRSDTLLVVGSGDVDEDQIKEWTAKLAQTIQQGSEGHNGKGEFEATGRPENADQRRLLIIDKPERTQTQINFGQIGVKMTDSDFFPLHLGNYAFGGPSFSAVLMTEIRVKRGWSYGANSAFRFGLQPRSWHVHLFPAAKDTPSALAYSLKLVETLKQNGLSPEQFNFSKKSLINSAGFMYNTPKKRVENKLLERTLDLPDGFMKTFGPALSKVSLSDVNSALKGFLKPEKMAITVLGTAKDLKEPLAKAAGVPLSEVEVVSYTQE